MSNSVMNNVMARACVNCKRYIVIHSENAESRARVKSFEKVHLKHMVITTLLDEVKTKGYSNEG